MHVFADTNRIKARFVLGLLVMGFGVLAIDGSAVAQSNYELKNRIKRLENEVETLSRALFRGEKPPAGSFSGGASDAAAQADLEIRLTQLESELRNVRGRMEEQNFEMRQLKEELERVRGDLELLIQDLEGVSGAGGSLSGSRTGSSQYINRSPSLTTGGTAGGASVGTETANGYQWKSGDSRPAIQLGTYTESPPLENGLGQSSYLLSMN